MPRRISNPVAYTIFAVVAALFAFAAWQNSKDAELEGFGPAPTPQPSAAPTDDARWKELEGKGKEAIPTCIALLGSEDPSQADRASDLLARIGGDAVPALVQALEAGQDRSRARAALALGRMGPAAREAIPALERAQAVPSLKDAASEAIAKIRGEPKQDVR